MTRVCISPRQFIRQNRSLIWLVPRKKKKKKKETFLNVERRVLSVKSSALSFLFFFHISVERLLESHKYSRIGPLIRLFRNSPSFLDSYYWKSESSSVRMIRFYTILFLVLLSPRHFFAPRKKRMKILRGLCARKGGMEKRGEERRRAEEEERRWLYTVVRSPERL